MQPDKCPKCGCPDLIVVSEGDQWSRALSAEEILRLYNDPYGAFLDGAVYYVKEE